MRARPTYDFVSYFVILPIFRTISAMRSASLKMTSAAFDRGRVVRLEPAHEQLGVAHHARERLVQLVGRGARQLGDDRLPLLREDLLLRLREALLHAHLLAQVGEDADASRSASSPS